MDATDIDPVLLTLALLGGCGFVAMALLWAIQGAGRHNDGVTWAAERERLEDENAALRAELADALEQAAAGWRDAQEGWTHAQALVDEADLARHHQMAAREGLAPGGTAPPEWN
jgi:hypothetical protein